MELTGHSGEVFCAKFDPNGNYIASGSMDRSISKLFFKFLRNLWTDMLSSALENLWYM
jgi:WD40 repeat protein